MAHRLKVRKGGDCGHEEPTRQRSPSRPNQGRDLEEPGFQRKRPVVQHPLILCVPSRARLLPPSTVINQEAVVSLMLALRAAAAPNRTGQAPCPWSGQLPSLRTQTPYNTLFDVSTEHVGSLKTRTSSAAAERAVLTTARERGSIAIWTVLSRNWLRQSFS